MGREATAAEDGIRRQSDRRHAVWGPMPLPPEPRLPNLTLFQLSSLAATFSSQEAPFRI